MKKIFLALMIGVSNLFLTQLKNINSGEKLSYRIHYGFINAGTATMTTSNITYNGTPHLKVYGVGRSSGVVNTFFKVNDIYESYIDIATGLPSFYVRNVSEGKYRKHLETTFNHEKNTLVLYDKLDKKTRNFKAFQGIQDMLSAFYYLRNLDNSQLKVGSQIKLNVWIDDETYPFLLKVVGKEKKKTKFGKIETLKIIPSVMSGRVFKEKEGVTMWVTNDQNHIPVEMEAKLLVGSLKASLDGYADVKHKLDFSK